MLYRIKPFISLEKDLKQSLKANLENHNFITIILTST